LVEPVSTEEEVLFLKRLGINESQGRVFIALQQSGSLTATDISRTSGVRREKVYTVLLSLQELGIVRKIITSPATFEAMAINEAADILLKRKLKTHQDLRKETEAFVKNFNVTSQRALQKEFAHELVMVPKKEAVIRRIRKSIEESEKSIDWATTWKRFLKIHLFADELAKAKNKGLRIRFVLEKPTKQHLLIELLRTIDIPLSQCKFIRPPIPAVVYLYDKKKAAMPTNREAGITESPAIVTNNPSFVALATYYFERIWMQAQTLNP
jgi:sugar-specific transcriptional regulator TrmB